MMHGKGKPIMNAKTFAGKRVFGVQMLFCTVTNLVQMYTMVQVWNVIPLHLPFSIVNVDTNLRVCMHLVT